MKAPLEMHECRRRAFKEEPNLITSDPPNQPLQQRYQTVCLSFAAIVFLIGFQFGTVTRSDGSGADSPKIEQSQQAKEVTYRGCVNYNGLHKRLTLTVVEYNENKDFDLVGNISTLPAHPDALLVSVSGVEVEPGIIDVKHVEELKLIAELDKSVTDPSQWIRKTDKAYGLSLAVPKEVSFGGNPNTGMRGPWEKNTLNLFNISFAVGREGGYNDGHISIYVNTAMSEADTYPAGQKVEWINGFKYTEVDCERGARDVGCAASTFQNHLSYRFEYTFDIGQPGMVSWGCLYQIINDQQERSFVRLFLSQVAFLRPEVPAADGRHIASSPPQVVRFDKTPLVSKRYWYSMSTVLSWEARNADYVQLSYICAPKVQLRMPTAMS